MDIHRRRITAGDKSISKEGCFIEKEDGKGNK